MRITLYRVVVVDVEADAVSVTAKKRDDMFCKFFITSVANIFG
jgi:hypothetical protein